MNAHDPAPERVAREARDAKYPLLSELEEKRGSLNRVRPSKPIRTKQEKKKNRKTPHAPSEEQEPYRANADPLDPQARKPEPEVSVLSSEFSSVVPNQRQDRVHSASPALIGQPCR